MVKFKTSVLLCFMLLLAGVAMSQSKKEKELAKTGNKHLKKEQYVQAEKIFSQLVSSNSENVEFNYKYGACLLHTSKKKTNALKYLKFAVKNSTETSEAHFYLAKAYHISYQFDKAIALYKQYKATLKPKELKELNIDLYIAECEQGKELIKDFHQLKVLKTKKMKRPQFFRGYKLGKLNRKILLKPDEFKTKEDLLSESKDPLLVVHGPESEVLMFSAYKHGAQLAKLDKDIYMVYKLEDGSWSNLQDLGPFINTDLDEDYPYLHPNGKTLYFSSKGHKGIGGYDIYRSELDTVTNQWGTPVNMGFSINSPFDDILYVVDGEENAAFFASDRQNKLGEIMVYKIVPPKEGDNFVLVKGDVKIEGARNNLAKISVVNTATGQFIARYKSNKKTGRFIFPLAELESYNLEFSFADSLKHSVELKTPAKSEKDIIYQQVRIAIPEGPSAQPVVKMMTLADYKASKEEKIKAYDELASLEKNQLKDVKFAPKVIKEKPKQREPRPKMTAVEPVEEAQSTEEVQSPEEMLANAELELETTKEEKIELAEQINAGYVMANKKNQVAEDLSNELKQMMEAAGDSPSEAQTKEIVQKQVALESAAEEAVAALRYAKSQESNYQVKEKEERLAESYLAAVTTANSGDNNAEALQQLEKHQSEMAKIQQELSAVNKTDNIGELKKTIGEKKNDRQKSEKKVTKIKSDLELIVEEQKLLQEQIESTRKKAIKEELSLQIDELKVEENKKREELVSAEKKQRAIINDVDIMSDQLELFNEIEVAAKNSAVSSTNHTERNSIISNIKKTVSEKDASASKIGKKNMTTYAPDALSSEDYKSSTGASDAIAESLYSTSDESVDVSATSGNSKDSHSDGVSGNDEYTSTEGNSDSNNNSTVANSSSSSSSSNSIDEDNDELSNSLTSTGSADESSNSSTTSSGLGENESNPDESSVSGSIENGSIETGSNENYSVTGSSNSNNEAIVSSGGEGSSDVNNTNPESGSSSTSENNDVNSSDSNSNNGSDPNNTNNLSQSENSDFLNEQTNVNGEAVSSTNSSTEGGNTNGANSVSSSDNSDTNGSVDSKDVAGNSTGGSSNSSTNSTSNSVSTQNTATDVSTTTNSTGLYGTKSSTSYTQYHDPIVSAQTKDELISSDLEGLNTEETNSLSERVFNYPPKPENGVEDAAATSEWKKSNDKLSQALAVQQIIEKKKSSITEDTSPEDKANIEAEISNLQDQVYSLKKSAVKHQSESNRVVFEKKREEQNDKIFADPSLETANITNAKNRIDKLWKESASLKEKMTNANDTETKDRLEHQILAVEAEAINIQKALSNTIENVKKGGSDVVEGVNPAAALLADGSAGNGDSSVNGEVNANASSTTNNGVNNSSGQQNVGGSSNSSTSLNPNDESDNSSTTSTNNGSENGNSESYNGNDETSASSSTGDDQNGESADSGISFGSNSNSSTTSNATSDAINNNSTSASNGTTQNNGDASSNSSSTSNDQNEESADSGISFGSNSNSSTTSNATSDAINSSSTSADNATTQNNGGATSNSSSTNNDENRESSNSTVNTALNNGTYSSTNTSTVNNTSKKELLAAAEKFDNQAKNTSDLIEKQRLEDEAEVRRIAADENKTKLLEEESISDINSFIENFKQIDQAKQNAKKNESSSEAVKSENKANELFEKVLTQQKQINEETDLVTRVRLTKELSELTAYAKLKQVEATKKYEESAIEKEDPNYSTLVIPSSSSTNDITTTNDAGVDVFAGANTNNSIANTTKNTALNSSDSNSSNNEVNNTGSSTSDTNESVNESSESNDSDSNNGGDSSSSSEQNSSGSDSVNDGSIASNNSHTNSESNATSTNSSSVQDGRTQDGTVQDGSSTTEFDGSNDTQSNTQSNQANSSNQANNNNQGTSNDLDETLQHDYKPSKKKTVLAKEDYITAYERLIREATEIEAKEATREFKIEELNFLAKQNREKSEKALSEIQTMTDEVAIQEKLNEANAYRQEAEDREVSAKKEEYVMNNNLAEAKSKRAEAKLIKDGINDGTINVGIASASPGDNTVNYDDAENHGSYSPSTTLTKKGLKITPTARYNKRTKIPVDVELPEGIVYKVQVGAFRQAINPRIFNGISPLTGEKTSTGITRYTAGLFTSFKAADMAKGRIRNLGYKDAFVVVFNNGKRISVEQAEELRNNLSSKESAELEEKKEKEVAALKKAGIKEEEANTTNTNVVSPIERERAVTKTKPNNAASTTTARIDPANSLNNVSGVYYTVQVGVYTTPRTSAQLYNIIPLQTYKTSNGYIRYSTGVFRNVEDAKARKQEIIATGVSDAYVVGYKDGVRIDVPQSRSSRSTTSTRNTQIQTTKSNNEGIVFKIQIGAFRKQINISSNPVLKQLSSFGVDYSLNSRGVYIYTVGKLKTKADADELKRQVVNLGIPDAFIVAYNNGRKISVSQAVSLSGN